MSLLKLFHNSCKVRGTIRLPGSKSESNRALILNALSGNMCSIENLSTANDTIMMQRALAATDKTIDIEDSGTCLRFLLAFFCATNQNKILTGTSRLCERPIAPLVDALSEMGFNIRYINKEGYSPLEIIPLSNPKKIEDEVFVSSTESSQFLSALMMIGPFLPKGLTIHLEGNVNSFAYAEMTISMLRYLGFVITKTSDGFHISKCETHKLQTGKEISIGADWSAASYWYSIAFLSAEAEVFLEGLKDDWLQGDRVMADWMKRFGVVTEFNENGAWIRRLDVEYPTMMKLNFNDNPDLAQTMAVMFSAKNIYATFSGLETLKKKETDRIAALQSDLAKVNVNFDYSQMYDFYQLKGDFQSPTKIFETYGDHRMAMSFAPLSLLSPIWINNPEVVSKSYPGFWDDLASVGFELELC